MTFLTTILDFLSICNTGSYWQRMASFGDFVRFFVSIGCVILCYSVLEEICKGVVLVCVVYFVYKSYRKLSERKLRAEGQGILITGCDTGLSRQYCLCLCLCFICIMATSFNTLNTQIQMSRAMRKCVLCHMRTIKAQISLPIRAV